jgi:hypothetical protein
MPRSHQRSLHRGGRADLTNIDLPLGEVQLDHRQREAADDTYQSLSETRRVLRSIRCPSSGVEDQPVPDQNARHYV